MNLAKLRAATAPILTLALGGFTALAVAFASFDVLWDAARVQEEAFQSRLELVAVLAQQPGRALVLPPPPPAPDAAPPAPDAAPTESAEAQSARQRLTEMARLGKVGGLFVASRDAELKAWAGAASEEIGRAGLDACAGARVNEQLSWASFQDANGQPWRATCSPIRGEQGDLLGWAIAVAEPTYLSEQEDRGAQTRALIVLMGSLVGLGVIVGVRFILAPIREVAQAAERMATGERGVRVPTPGDPEIAQVAAALNELASAVEAREDEIRSRLASVAQLSSMVAHEVRNPLQSLSLLATLARTEKDPTERDTLLTSIETEINVLEGVVQRFLRSSGPLQISRTSSDLVEIIQKAMGVATPQARNRQVTVDLVAPARLPMVMDPSLVRRALENLLLNAIEFSGQEPPGVVKVEIVRRGREAVITVDDNGPGVPARERDSVFKPYYSSKAGGTGLGLALVKQVVQAHGGAIRCEDSPLGGARFVATLPVDESLEVPFAR